MVVQPAKENLIYAVSCMDMFAVSLVIPVFTQHLQSIGVSNFTIGLLNSLYSGVQFLSSPIIGHMSDIFGSKNVLLTTLLVCSICYPVMGVVTSILSLIVVRLAIAFAKHTQLLCKNYIEESTVDKTHIQNFGKLSGFTSLGYIVGPVISGYIIDLQNGFLYMSCSTGLIFFANSLLVYALSSSKTTKKVPVKGATNFFDSFKNIPWSVCWDLFLLKCLTVFAVFAFYINYSQSVMTRYRVSSIMVGYSFSLQGIVRAVTGFAIHRVHRLFPRHANTLLKVKITYIIVIISLLGLYFSSNFYGFLLLLMPLNVCICYCRIINHEALIERIRDCNTGIILGAFNNVTAVARFMVPPITGYVVDRFHYDSVYVISVLSLLCCVFIISIRNGKQRTKVE